MARIADEAPVVAGSYRDGRVVLLHAETGAILKALPQATGEAELWRLDIDRSGDLLALLTRDNRVWLWRWRTEEAPSVVATLPGELSTWKGWRFGAALEFGPQGERLLVGHVSGGALLLDRQGQTIATFGHEEPAAPEPGEAGLTDSGSAGPPDTETEVGFVDEDGRRWGVVHATGFDFPRSWSKDGARLALITGQGPCVFDTKDGKLLAAGIGPGDDRMESLALSPEGDHLVTGCYGGAIAKYEVATGTKVWSHVNEGSFGTGHDPGFNPISIGALRFSPDGGLVAATTTTGIHGVLLKASSGKVMWEGGHRGGRMGEPAEIVWMPKGNGFYFAYVSGVMAIAQVRLRKKPDPGFAGERGGARGTLPDLGWGGIGAYASSDVITAIDGESFEPLWFKGE